LITGGCGFIGSHLADGLLDAGYKVTALDSLSPQVHGPKASRPEYLDSRVRFVEADVRDRQVLDAELRDADVVLHQAAAVGVGQSMYDIVDYCGTNVMGTAVLCELLARGNHSVQKLLVASSMSNYGEGSAECEEHGRQSPPGRSRAQLLERQWEVLCPRCGRAMVPCPTDESKPMQPASVYATTKKTQEELVLNVGRAYGIPSVALRYFNAYGPRQALSNPYTGVAAIFVSRLLSGQPPKLFEDGRQRRDFVHVFDVVQANLLALEHDGADGRVINVGSGRSIDLLELAAVLADYLGSTQAAEVVGEFREGDIRHCYADITVARTTLGYEPRVRIEDGVKDLIEWASDQTPEDRTAEAMAELQRRNLVF
jgi:dTDP-L-rhamnose 4-epimerase